MSASRSQWIRKRGQADAGTAIDQVLDQQPGEQVHQIADAQVEDSPYQARRSFSAASVEDLAQAMRESGFHGVLIVRPHGDPAKRAHGFYQLVYGHRRRTAWQCVCAERGEPCFLPVVVREMTDERLLTIGAQENLQREDLDPIEEAQIVDWHQHLFSDKNQAEIGAMLGKSSDWVSVRARIAKLPASLKERLRQRPRAISQMLELGVLAAQQPAMALQLADRVVEDNLTLETIRTLVRGYVRPEQRVRQARETAHNRRGAATIVPDITKIISDEVGSPDDEPAQPMAPQDQRLADRPAPLNTIAALGRANQPMSEQPPPDAASHTGGDNDHDVVLLEQVVASLAAIAIRAKDLPPGTSTTQALDQAERALAQVRSGLTWSALDHIPVASKQYQLLDTDLRDMLVVLLRQQPSLVTMHHGQSSAPVLSVVMFVMPRTGSNGSMPQRSPSDLFIAVSGAGHGVVPLITEIPTERVRNSLGIPPEAAITLAALISDLAHALASLGSS